MAAKILPAFLSTLILASCAQMPQWSEGPANCEYGQGKYVQGFNKVRDENGDGLIIDKVKTGTRKYVESRQICVEQPEVVKLPSYIDLLNLPPAENMPVVAVYNFIDKTGQRKDSQLQDKVFQLL